MVLPPYDAEVILYGVVSSLGAVCMDGRGFLQVLLVPFPKGPRLIQLISLWNRTFLDCLDKHSFTAVNFIRSENNPALLQLFMLLELSEHML